MSWFAVGSGLSGSSVGSSAITASSFSSGGKILVAPEYDKERRRAKVYLFTRPVDAMPEAKSEAYHHWALVFAFEDGSWRTLEGFGNDKNKLAPSYTKESPREEGTYRLLGEVVVSPWELREFAVNNECNGKPYLATLYNCQDWVNNLAKHFGEAIREKIKNFKTLKVADPFLAVVGGSLASSKNTLFSSSR